MVNPKSLQNLIPAKKGEVRNPNGIAKGTKHINTWIQELLADEGFKTTVREGLEIKEYKGAPIKAMVKAQMMLAINGDTKAFDTLAKHGWSQKIETDITSGGEKIEFNAERAEQLIRARGSRTDIQGSSS